jgi:hypothetical protein
MYEIVTQIGDDEIVADEFPTREEAERKADEFARFYGRDYEVRDPEEEA